MKTKTLMTICILAAFLLGGCSKPENPNSAEVQIVTNPENATATINGKTIGNTPLKLKLAFGTYILQLDREKHRTEFRKINVTAPAPQKIEIELPPVTASVLFTSTPSGAIVSIGDRQLGQTPLVLHDVQMGKHSASFSLPGRVAEEAVWEISDARPVEVHSELKSNVGTLRIESDPAEANVSIGGKYVGKTPFSSEFEQGELDVKVHLDGYTTYESKVTVIRDETTTVTANLSILPGSLLISSTPPGANVYLNGEPCRQTPLEIKDLGAGTYTVKVEMDTFDTEEREVKVAPGKQTEANFVLSTNLGGIDLSVNPPGVAIYLDDKKIGVTEAEGPGIKDISKVFEIRNVKSGKHTIALRHSRANPNEKKITVQVEKGQITRPKQETMWVADTYVKLKKGGREMKGRIRQQNNNEILFEPEPTIRIRYGRDEIEIIKPLTE